MPQTRLSTIGKPQLTVDIPQSAVPSKATAKANNDPKVHKRGSNILTFKLLIAFAIPVYLEILDYTVVAPSVSRISSAYNQLESASLIGTIYHLTVATWLPLFASVADVYGRNFALQTALVVFFLGSVISTGALDIETLIVGRGISGIGIGGILTVIRIITSDSASLNPAHWQAYVLVFLSGVGFSTGPIIGAAVMSISFRWVFAINLPATLLASVLVYLLIARLAKGPQPCHHDCPCDFEGEGHMMAKLLHIDWTSAICWMVGGILILLGLNWGSEGQFSQTRVIVSISVGAAVIFLSLAWQYIVETVQENRVYLAELDFQDVEKGEKQHVCPPRAFKADAMIPLFVLSSYDTCVTQLAAFSTGMAFTVTPYFLGVYSALAIGMSPAEVGIRLIHYTPAMSLGMVFAILMVRFLHQPKWPILIGSTLIPLSLGLIAWGIANKRQGLLNVFMIMSGFGVGVTFGPLAAQSRTPKRNARVPTVVLNLFFRGLGATVGLAQSYSILSTTVNRTLSENGLNFSTANIHTTQQISDLATDIQTLVRDAYSDGVEWAFIGLLPWAGLSLVLCLFLTLKPPPPAKKLRPKSSVASRKSVVSRKSVIGPRPPASARPVSGISSRPKSEVPTRPKSMAQRPMSHLTIPVPQTPAAPNRRLTQIQVQLPTTPAASNRRQSRRQSLFQRLSVSVRPTARIPPVPSIPPPVPVGILRNNGQSGESEKHDGGKGDDGTDAQVAAGVGAGWDTVSGSSETIVGSHEGGFEDDYDDVLTIAEEDEEEEEEEDDTHEHDDNINNVVMLA